MGSWDAIVVGHGLAGAAVAWQLRRAGRRVLVIDRPSPASASRVAAGLVTPITGRRLVRIPGFDELYAAAAEFYRRMETETGERFFTARNAVRLFADGRERAKLATAPEAVVNPEWFAAPHGGFELAPAARLDVPRYLDASRARLEHDGCFLEAAVDPRSDLVINPDSVALPRLGVRADGVVFCQGLDGRENPWFPHLRFTPAKGEVLALRVPGLAEERVVHRGAWLASAGGDLFRVGATYDRDDLSPMPTDRGRAELVARLREFLRLPFEVVGHAAGVRPILAGMTPVAAVHPEHPQLAVLNGLGSKGALLAPTLAARLLGCFEKAVHSPPGSC